MLTISVSSWEHNLLLIKNNEECVLIIMLCLKLLLKVKWISQLIKTVYYT